MLTRPRGPAHAPSLRFWRVHRRTSALFVVPALSLTTALVTGVLYLLPLSQATTDLVSNISCVIIALTRLVLDGLWIAAGLAVAGWHWVHLAWTGIGDHGGRRGNPHPHGL